MEDEFTLEVLQDAEKELLDQFRWARGMMMRSKQGTLERDLWFDRVVHFGVEIEKIRGMEKFAESEEMR